MNRKLRDILILLCLCFTLTSCTAAPKGSVISENQPVESLSAEKLSAHQADAYYAVFLDLFQQDPALNAGKYLAIDFSQAMLADTAPLILHIQAFCDEQGYTLLQDTFSGLEEKGYIADNAFTDGFLISFEDQRLDEEQLVTLARKWRTGLGAFGAEYKADWKNGQWVLADLEMIEQS